MDEGKEKLHWTPKQTDLLLAPYSILPGQLNRGGPAIVEHMSGPSIPRSSTDISSLPNWPGKLVPHTLNLCIQVADTSSSRLGIGP